MSPSNCLPLLFSLHVGGVQYDSRVEHVKGHLIVVFTYFLVLFFDLGKMIPLTRRHSFAGNLLFYVCHR